MVEGSQRSIEIRNRRSELERLARAVDAFAADAALPRSVLHALQVSLDELVTNIVEHGYDPTQAGKHAIRIHLRTADGAVHVDIEDDAGAFNPLDYPPPDTEAPLEDREIGGLGVHLARSLMDDVSYSRVDGRNRVSLTRHVDTP